MGEKGASELLESLMAQPALPSLLEELSTLYFGDELSALVSRDLSIPTFEVVLTKLRRQPALGGVMARFDALSGADYSSQILTELNETIASGPTLEDGLSIFLAAPTTAQFVEQLTQAWSSPLSARELMVELQQPYLTRNVLAEAGLLRWFKSRGLSKDFSADFSFRLCSLEGEACECRSGVLALTPVTL